MSVDLSRMKAELEWLQKHPEFDERPATIREFVGKDYLNIEERMRPAIMDTLVDIFGETVSSRQIAKYQRAMITGGIGIGKGHPVDEPVLTPDGFKPVGDLEVGDNVIGSDGKPTKVTAVYLRGVLPVYRVKFTDGSSVRVDGDHLWTVSKIPRGKKMTLSTRDIKADGLQTNAGQNKYTVQLMEPFEGRYLDFGIDPYVIGFLIGDGHISGNTPGFTTADAEVVIRLNKTMPEGVDVRRSSDSTGMHYNCSSSVYAVNPLTKILRVLGLWGKTTHTKRIPEAFFTASIDQRIELLRGLMDSDGWVTPSNNNITFTTVNKELAEDVAALVRSLGGVSRVCPRTKQNAYDVRVNTTFNPFWLARKADLWQSKSQGMKRYMEDISFEGKEEVICISVAANDSLYITKDYLVTHNTTIASVVLPYLAHWLLCLKDPQGFFNLLPGSRLALMQMSTSGSQAKEVVFGDIKARVEHSPWFQSKYPYDSNFKNQLRFEKEIWILPGDSAETTFEGYNILGGILDEADSHKVTQNKDYAEQGFTTIYSRITSRFQERGFILVIGQMKKANGFAAKKYKEFSEDPGAYATRMAIWESFGWEKYLDANGERDSFFYDTVRKDIIPKGAAKLVDNENLIEIPNTYKQDFLNNPEKALRDLAGIPPATGSPFISLTYKITEARDRWLAKHAPYRGPIVKTTGYLPQFEDWFYAPDTLKRVCHIDMAYSANGDALGFAMGHVSEMIEVDDERKPYISFDLLMRIHAPAGQEIFLGDVRRIIYELKQERKFRIDLVTMDGFQSTDTRQQLERKRINTDIVSVDRSVHPYHDLREAIYEGRIDFPEYMVRIRDDDTELTEIAIKELTELSDEGNKIDHPHDGSKDVADAMAGVVYGLMGDRTYHKKGVRTISEPAMPSTQPKEGYRLAHPSLMRQEDMRAPVPPTSAPVPPSSTQWRPPRRG